MSGKLKVIPRRRAVKKPGWVRLHQDPAKPGVQEFKFAGGDFSDSVYSPDSGVRLDRKTRETQEVIEEFTGHSGPLERWLRRVDAWLLAKFRKQTKEENQC